MPTAHPTIGAATSHARKPATTPANAIQPGDRAAVAAGLVRQLEASPRPARYLRSWLSSASAPCSSASSECAACSAAVQDAHVRTWAATAAASSEDNASASHKSRISSSGQAIRCHSLSFELTAEPFAGTQQGHTNVVDGLLGQLGDVGVGHVGEVAQHDGYPLRLRQAAHRVANEVAALTARDDLAWIGRAADLLELDLGFSTPKGVSSIAAATAQLVQRFVGGDTQEPGVQRPRLVEAREMLIGFEKGAVGHLGGRLPIGNEAQHGAKDCRLVGFDQCRECRLIAGAALSHEVLGRVQAQLGDGHVCSIRYYTRAQAVLTAGFVAMSSYRK